jgi:hypothetical protein
VPWLMEGLPVENSFVGALAAVLKLLVAHVRLALLWIVAVSVLMIIGSVGPSSPGVRRLGRH